MTTWVSCAPLAATGFDLACAVLLSPDALDGDGGRATSRATATVWRESLWRTADGHHVVGLDSGGARSSGLDADRWRWVSPMLAEDWLRRQDLHETADAEFGPRSRPPSPPVVLTLDHTDLVRLEQLSEDEDTTVSATLRQAVAEYLDRCAPRAVTGAGWWPLGVAGGDQRRRGTRTPHAAAPRPPASRLGR